MTRLVLIPAMLIAEGVAMPYEPVWVRFGVPVVLLGVIIALWREDRNSRITAQTTTSTQYVDLVAKLLATVETNTSAMQGLRDSLNGKVAACPFDGAHIQQLSHQIEGMDKYLHDLRHDVISIASGRQMITKADG